MYDLLAEPLRAKVGSFEDMKRTFGNELYSPLVGSGTPATLGMQVRGDVARAEVRATDGSVYLVSLARRDHGPQAGRWTITALARDVPGGS